METPYKVAAVALLFLAGLGRTALGHERLRAATRTRRPETGMAFLVAVYLPATLALVAYLAGDRLDAFRLPLPAWLRWAGAGVMLAGDALFIWAHRAIGKHWSPVLEIHEGHVLVTAGPYRHVRHPMYSAWLALCTGLSILTANVAIAIAWLGGHLVLLAARLPAEEQMMRDEFGDAYRHYQERTGALFPRR